MTTIEEDFVSFETAKLLKEKGFDARCPMIYTADGELLYTDVKHHNMYAVTNKQLYYYTDIIAPSQAVVMKWLREVHNLFIQPEITPWPRKGFFGNIYLYREQHNDFEKVSYVKYEESYEQVCEAAIKYTLEHLI